MAGPPYEVCMKFIFNVDSLDILKTCLLSFRILLFVLLIVNGNILTKKALNQVLIGEFYSYISILNVIITVVE